MLMQRRTTADRRQVEVVLAAAQRQWQWQRYGCSVFFVLCMQRYSLALLTSHVLAQQLDVKHAVPRQPAAPAGAVASPAPLQPVRPRVRSRSFGGAKDMSRSDSPKADGTAVAKHVKRRLRLLPPASLVESVGQALTAAVARATTVPATAVVAAALLASRRGWCSCCCAARPANPCAAAALRVPMKALVQRCQHIVAAVTGSGGVVRQCCSGKQWLPRCGVDHAGNVTRAVAHLAPMVSPPASASSHNSVAVQWPSAVAIVRLRYYAAQVTPFLAASVVQACVAARKDALSTPAASTTAARAGVELETSALPPSPATLVHFLQSEVTTVVHTALGKGAAVPSRPLPRATALSMAAPFLDAAWVVAQTLHLLLLPRHQHQHHQQPRRQFVQHCRAVAKWALHTVP